ncbi:MAG: cbb3-type cytochrome oxidase assembly protein CcoS [Xanthomonadales bacterium]|nr:cbb3-type cytochrome oxidase assembly protein CcoS [Xanthomonadales bacterium]
MSILILMIPLSLLFVLGAGAAFFWAVNHDQFEDMDSPALLPLSEPGTVSESGAIADGATADATGEDDASSDAASIHGSKKHDAHDAPRRAD